MFEDFLKEKIYLRGVSHLTIRSYRQAYDRYIKFGKIFPPTEFSLKQFVIGMKDAGLASTTCNISIRAMNSYLTWLKENGHIREPLRIKQVKEEKRVRQGYSDAELSRLLSFKPGTFFEWRLYALICLLTDTGIRIDEAVTLQRSKVDFENLIITVKGKGDKERVVPMSYELRKVLFKYLKRVSSRWVFPTRSGGRLSYRNALRDFAWLCHKVDVPYKPFHYLRRTFARNYITQGGSLFMLQRCLGHESITTTQRYVNLNVDDLKEVHLRTSILGRLK